MLRAVATGLLMLAAVPLVADASVQTAAIDDTMAMVRAGPSAESGTVDDCEAPNVLRRLAGCSAVIRSGKADSSNLSRAYRNRGMALFSLGEKKRAIQDFDKAIRFDRRNAALYLARGTAWQHLDDHARAAEDLVLAIEFDPVNAAAYGNLGIAWEKLGDDDRALDNYDRSIELNPENAIVLNNRGNVLARMGQRREAIADYDRALGVDPEYASAYYNRAGERCLEGEAGPAVSDYLNAIRLGERQRTALQDFLAGQGYYEGSDKTSGATLEAALRRWSESTCTARSQSTADTSDGDGDGDGDAVARRDGDS